MSNLGEFVSWGPHLYTLKGNFSFKTINTSGINNLKINASTRLHGFIRNFEKTLSKTPLHFFEVNKSRAVNYITCAD